MYTLTDSTSTKEKKTDRRTRYTQSVIQEAFLTLLQEKSIDKITVTEICKMADINRGTFYLHYQNPFEVLEQIENDYIEKFVQHSYDTMAKPIATQYEFSLPTHWLNSKDPVLKILSDTTGISRIIQCVFDRIKPALIQNLTEQYRFSSNVAEAVYAYLYFGCIAVDMQFLKNPTSKQEIAQITDIIDQLIRYGTEQFKS